MLDDLISWTNLDGLALASLASGFGVAATIYAAYVFFAPTLNARLLKQRLTAVKDRRAELRDTWSNAKPTKGKSNDRNLALMKQALENLQMEAMINDNALKLKLARAGRRGRNEAIRFLFMRLAAPPILALAAFLYIGLVVKPDGWDTTRLLLASLGVGAVGYFLPGILLSNQTQKRQAEIMKTYPDALDLLSICVEAGMSIEQSFNRVSGEISNQSIALTEELQLTTAELSYLGDRRQAFENFASRTGLSAVRAITSALIQAEKYGTPIGAALRVISQESRDERMSKAEQKAASLPAKLTVPMIVFFLPGLFVVILGPAIMQMMNQ